MASEKPNSELSGFLSAVNEKMGKCELCFGVALKVPVSEGERSHDISSVLAMDSQRPSSQQSG